MSPQGSNSSFHGVDLRGKNSGATMSIRASSARKFDNNCSINIYINNNVQGVNNSILVGSKVKLRDPGVRLRLGDLRLEIESLGTKNNRGRNKDKSRSSLSFCGMVSCLCFILILFLLVLTTPI